MLLLLKLLSINYISDQLTILIAQNVKTREQASKHIYKCTHIVCLSKMK
jgi:hypothetical protein